MTQEDKQLLLKDLCARLPYEVKMKYKDEIGYEILCQIDTFYTDSDGFHCLLRTTSPPGIFQDLNELKPYLRPMSSMTKEERKEYTSYCFEQPFLQKDKTPNLGSVPMCIDWLNAHHFDFRNLIESGLAIDCTSLNIY